MIETQHETAGQTLLLASLWVRGSHCALNASTVQEVIRVDVVTPVRHAPLEVAGVINLRGRIVTLLDLGRILGYGPSTITAESRIFIVEDRTEFLGVLVDRVGDVVEVEVSSLGPLPLNLSPARSRFFKAVCRVSGSVLAILDSDEVFNESPL